MSGGVHTEGTRSLIYGLGVLRAFDAEHPVRSISEVADILGVSRPTVHRYAATLLELGYLEQAPMRRYRLTRHAAELGVAAVEALGITRRARPVVGRLRDASGATVSLALADGAEIVCLLHARGYLAGSYELAYGIGAGSRLPADSTPAGIALAHSPAGEVEIHRMRSRESTALTVVIQDGLRVALEMVAPARSVDQKSVSRWAARLRTAYERLSSPPAGHRHG